MRKAGWLLAVLGLLAGPSAVPAAGQQPVASADTNWEGVALEVSSVERKGQVLTLKWTLRNEGEKQVSVGYSVYEGGSYTADTYVLDEERGTKYFVLMDEGNKAVAGALSFYLQPGKTRRMWAKFPAPPPEVDRVTLVFGQTEPLEEVPITDR